MGRYEGVSGRVQRLVRRVLGGFGFVLWNPRALGEIWVVPGVRLQGDLGFTQILRTCLFGVK